MMIAREGAPVNALTGGAPTSPLPEAQPRPACAATTEEE